MCHQAERRLECRAESVGTARRFVADALEHWGVGADDPAAAVIADVVLVTSELVGNASRVCSGQIVVRLEAHRDLVEVTVGDDGADLPAPAGGASVMPDLESLGGRGLAIVAALSTHWGQRPSGAGWRPERGHLRVHPTGKEIWSELPVPAGSALGTHCDL